MGIIRAIYNKATANIILNSEKQSFSSTIRNKTGVSTLSISIQHSSGRASHDNQRIKRNKINPNNFPFKDHRLA